MSNMDRTVNGVTEQALAAGFVTIDTGNKVEFASGMHRNAAVDKPLPHLVLSGPMFDRWGGLLARGAKIYGANNWLKAAGQPEYDRFKESAIRHFMQWYRGEVDEDHAAAVFFNINGAEYVLPKLVK